MLVKADRSDERGWRACYSYADKILPLQKEFYRSDDCSFNNSYWRAKRDKEKYHDFLSGIDRVVLERRISASDDIRKRISAIDEQSLSDEARDRLTYLRQEVEKSYEHLSDIQRDLLALEKWPEQKENVPALGAKPRVADGDGSEVIDGGMQAQGVSVVAQKLEDCDFLLNKNFKRSAKVYLCLFSASWCGPCRREMPRISKTYTEMLKDDPDIELIHFSRDQNDAKAKAWAKEHNVKFPVVKPNGGNPLDLHSRGIPHLFIVKADGALLEEGHPMRIFNEEKLLTIREELRRVREAKSAAAGAKSAKEAAKNRTSTQSIIDGMIKVPGKDYWLSETELTQGQWESVMGDNPSEHKGATLPVERVSRNDCDVFLGKLNQTKEVRNSQFVFSLPTEGEWLCATRTKGDILDRAWVLENSSTQTHAVATKAANELGFYDMQGNVWEWLANDKVSKGCRRGGAFSEGKGGCSVHRWIHTPRGRRYNCCGLRLAAHVRPSQGLDKGDMEMRSPKDANGLYCVIDISGGSNAGCYPVSYLNTEPRDGWTDEHKTNKIVLRRVDAGTWPTMDGRRVTFTKPFYIGIFELTQKQIKLVTGDEMRKFVFQGDMRPADCLTWEEMRGKNDEFDYPKTKEVASGCVIGRLRAKTGLGSIDLPTSYQYGCAWNAGTDGSGRDARLTGRHFHNQRDGKGAFNAQHTTVGSYQPNEWGIYDLHGNVWEMCLDRCGSRKDEETDPEGPVEGEKRQLRGGGWHSSDSFIFSNFIPQNKEANDTHGMTGCRIVINTLAEKAKERRQQL